MAGPLTGVMLESSETAFQVAGPVSTRLENLTSCPEE